MNNNWDKYIAIHDLKNGQLKLPAVVGIFIKGRRAMTAARWKEIHRG